MWVCGVHLSSVMKTNSSKRCREMMERRKREGVFEVRLEGEIKKIRLIYDGKRKRQREGGGKERQTHRQMRQTGRTS